MAHTPEFIEMAYQLTCQWLQDVGVMPRASGSIEEVLFPHSKKIPEFLVLKPEYLKIFVSVSAEINHEIMNLSLCQMTMGWVQLSGFWQEGPER